MMDKIGCMMFLVVALAATAAVAGANLLNNPEFKGDNLGEILGWDIRNHDLDRLTRLPMAGPDGETALRLDIAAGQHFSQSGIVLVEGEDYRLKLKVRTSGLRRESMRFFVRNSWWNSTGACVFLPEDTGGQWVTLESVAHSPKPSLQPQMICGFYCDNPGTGAVIEVASPVLEAVTEKGEAGARRVECGEPYPARIVPVDPLLSRVDAASAKMTFYFGADLERPENDYGLLVELDGKLVDKARMDASRRIHTDWGRISEGEHRLKVKLYDRDHKLVCVNEYPVLAREYSRYSKGRKLNNFVTELFAADVREGEVRYVNPRNGWLWTEFTPSGGRPVERFLKKSVGEQTFNAPSDGFLRIHAIKQLLHSAEGLYDQHGRTDISNYSYARDFYDLFIPPFFTEYNLYGGYGYKFPHLRAWLGKWGIGMSAECGFSASDRSTLVTAVAASVENKMFRQGVDISLDESMVWQPRAEHCNSAEAFWRGIGATNSVSVWWSGPNLKTFSDPRAQASEISAIVNSGQGRGMLLAETYLPVAPKWETELTLEESYLNFARSVAKMVPAAESSVVYVFGGYVTPFGSNCYSSPEADLKYVFDHFMRRLATDPDLAGLGGVGTTAFQHANDELMRWIARCVRHYAILGRTDSVAEKFGFRHLPGHVKNPDFAEGLAGWTVFPAEEGSVTSTTVKNYGSRVQGRHIDFDIPDDIGDSVALLRRSAKGPNRLSQKISGLVPGNYYILFFSTSDPKDVADPGSVATNFAFRAEIKGGKRVEGLSFDSCKPRDRRPDGTRESRSGHTKYPLVWLHQVVFRAESEGAVITFFDWASDREPGAPVGASRYLNYIILRPYYNEGEEQVRALDAFAHL